MSGSKVTFWKPFERWTEIMGNRTEHLIHADFGLPPGVTLEIFVGGELEMIEVPPHDKLYKVHLKICLEEFDSGEE